MYIGEKSQEYEECGKVSRPNLVFSSGQRIHTDDSLYECKECGTSFIVYGQVTQFWEFILVR